MKTLTVTLNQGDDFGPEKEQDVTFYDVASFEFKDDFFVVTMMNGDIQATRRFKILKYSLTNN